MDKEFFVSQIEACGSMLYRVAWSMLRNEDDCRDALQETALKAWEKRSKLHERRYFKTWIVRILINVCYDIQRKRRRVVSLEEIAEPSVPPPDPTLAAALQALPEKLRLPLMLCYSEGMSYAEIAQALRLTTATVRGRIARGKEQLRKELDAE